jgi:uncharacterized protein (TIGR03382 family)
LALILAGSFAACFAKTTNVASTQVVTPTVHEDGPFAQNDNCNAGGGGSIGAVAVVGLLTLRRRSCKRISA